MFLVVTFTTLVFTSASSGNFRRYDASVRSYNDSGITFNVTAPSELECAYICKRDPGCVSMLHDMGRCSGCAKSCQLLASTPNASLTCWDLVKEREGLVVQERSAITCADLVPINGTLEKGVQELRARDGRIIRAHCLETGVTVMLERSHGEVRFDRTFQEYVDGFGIVGIEHWLGLRNLHELTYGTKSQIRIEYCCTDGRLGYELWSDFAVGESNNFTLTVGRLMEINYDVIDNQPHLYFNFSAGMPFIAKDWNHGVKENQNCSADLGDGGWWFNGCSGLNPTGLFDKSQKQGQKYMYNPLFAKHSLLYMKILFRKMVEYP